MTLPLSQSGLSSPPVAARQAAVFTRPQALAAGWSVRQVERRLAAGSWRRVTHVAIMSAAAEPTPMTGAWAVRLTWPDAVTSHWTAAAVHGFPVPQAHESALHAVVARNLRSTATVVAHRLDLEEHEVMRLDGLGGPALTTPARTAVDCLRVADRDEALQLFAWLATRRVLTREALAAEAATTDGRRGTPALVDLLARTRGNALSLAERRLHAALHRGRLGGWTANATVRLGGRLVVVDLLFARAGVVVEVDGYGAHGTREAFEQDRRRQNALVDAGYLVLRFTWRDLVEREDEVVAEIRRALDRRLSS